RGGSPRHQPALRGGDPASRARGALARGCRGGARRHGVDLRCGLAPVAHRPEEGARGVQGGCAMSRERKLQLVVGARRTGARLDGEAPITDAERAEAERLRVALESDREPTSSALKAAWSPEALDAPDHEALLARALGDLGAPPTKAEWREATALRDGLD